MLLRKNIIAIVLDSVLGVDFYVQIATATSRQEKVVGTHFFAPAYIMKLLENIYGSKTSAETVATVMKLGKTIKKVQRLAIPIVCKCDNYYLFVQTVHF